VYSGTGAAKAARSEALKVLDAVHECAGIIDVLPEELQERVLASLCVTFGLGGLVAHQAAIEELSGDLVAPAGDFAGRALGGSADGLYSEK
jgi:hypothetical protein